MKNATLIGSLALALSSALISLPSYAACPSGMNAEETISCITIEGAGYDYQTFMSELAAAKQDAGAAKVSANTSHAEDTAETVAKSDC